MSVPVTIYTSSVELSLGRVHLACTQRGLCVSVLGSRRAKGQLEAWISRHEPDATVVETAEGLADAIGQLQAYDGGELRVFDLDDVTAIADFIIEYCGLDAARGAA